MASFVSPEDVRAYLNIDGTEGLYSQGIIQANIETASNYLQRSTGRQFEPQNATTKTFTTDISYLSVPDLRSVISVTIGGNAATDYLLHANGDIYGALTFADFNIADYNGYATYGRGYEVTVVITGNWGWDPLPAELTHATKILAAWYTKRPDAVLTNTLQTGEGNIVDLSRLPPEVWMFKRDWSMKLPTFA